MLVLKKGVTGITVPILDLDNQEVARVKLHEGTSQDDLAKVFALDGCKRYFVEDGPPSSVEPSLKGSEEILSEDTPQGIEDAGASEIVGDLSVVPDAGGVVARVSKKKKNGK